MDTAIKSVPVARFLWDADRYEEATARGVFTPDDPIELIDGEIITHLSPQRSPHSATVSLVAEALRHAFGSGFYVREQQPLRLGERSIPEPDVAVVRGSAMEYYDAHPRTAALVVEVADTTLAIDRDRKLRLYSSEEVPEYWIVNLVDRCVEVNRQPAGERYAESRVYRGGDTIPVGLRAEPIAVDGFLR
jgi:Uma2 family endonuclease